MKRTISSLLVLITSLSVAIAQDGASKGTILPMYLSVKDALVKGDANAAASTAVQLVKVVKGSFQNEKADVSAIVKNADLIASNKEVKEQRIYFSALSDAMIALAKSVKLSTGPFYQQYCPMKKASWLSNEKSVKNPYYGSAMLTCGQVVETF